MGISRSLTGASTGVTAVKQRGPAEHTETGCTRAKIAATAAGTRRAPRITAGRSLIRRLYPLFPALRKLSEGQGKGPWGLSSVSPKILDIPPRPALFALRIIRVERFSRCKTESGHRDFDLQGERRKFHDGGNHRMGPSPGQVENGFLSGLMIGCRGNGTRVGGVRCTSPARRGTEEEPVSLGAPRLPPTVQDFL